VGPDVALTLRHLLCHLREHHRHAFIREQAMGAGFFYPRPPGNVADVILPASQCVSMGFQDALQQFLRIFPGGFCQIIFILVELFAVRVLFQELLQELSLPLCGRQMSGCILRQLCSLPGGDVAGIVFNMDFPVRLQIGGF